MEDREYLNAIAANVVNDAVRAEKDLANAGIPESGTTSPPSGKVRKRLTDNRNRRTNALAVLGASRAMKLRMDRTSSLA
jgi:hypothetical protein